MSQLALSQVTVPAMKNHSATVFIFHGLGDSGEGWASTAGELARQLPHIKFILPNAPPRPVTINMGFVMPAWYDIKTFDVDKINDDEGLMRSVAAANRLIRNEIDEGVPSKRIVIAGFSQGCAMALTVGLTSEYPFAGIIGLSGYLPCRDKVLSMATDANKQTPIFMAHGDQDNVVGHIFGEKSARLLENAGYSTKFKTYHGLTHAINLKELKDIGEFLNQVLPPRDSKPDVVQSQL